MILAGVGSKVLHLEKVSYTVWVFLMQINPYIIWVFLMYYLLWVLLM